METKTWVADLGNGYYKNPILYTDYSDPDVIRVEDDYFMVASSFCNAPGVPLLHSKDLVNWTVINYVVEQIPHERYARPAHGCGAWAPAIRYHEGIYYVFVPMPDEGIFVCQTMNPWGEWSKPHFLFEGKGWIDPCPFWDDDGRAYMVNGFAKSRIGFKSILQVVEMAPDCSHLIGEGKYVFDGNVNHQETIEGPKLYKRNGYYYIFAPAGGVKTGWQTVLRSKNIWGPYEYKNVLLQGDTNINGPHQGGWVDTPSGEDWFLHFQDVYAAGRIVHLQPMKWVNDWPIIGQPVEGADYGVPVMEYKKPDVGAEYPVQTPQASDEFDGVVLGTAWQWNANYREDWYAMDPEGSSIVLHAVAKDVATPLSDVPNLLLQKWCMPEFTADTMADISKLTDGDLCGMVSLGMNYGAVAVQVVDGTRKIVAITGKQTFQNERPITEENRQVIGELSENINQLYFRNVVYRIASNPDTPIIPREMIALYYSTDGENFTKAVEFEAKAGRWVGVKNGIFVVQESNLIGADSTGPVLPVQNAGCAAFDYFRIY